MKKSEEFLKKMYFKLFSIEAQIREIKFPTEKEVDLSIEDETLISLENLKLTMLLEEKKSIEGLIESYLEI